MRFVYNNKNISEIMKTLEYRATVYPILSDLTICPSLLYLAQTIDNKKVNAILVLCKKEALFFKKFLELRDRIFVNKNIQNELRKVKLFYDLKKDKII